MDLTRLTPVSRMAGDDPTDTALLRDLLDRAEGYLRSFQWCERIEEAYFGLGVGGIVAVFLFRIRPTKPDVDEWLWVISGDLPPAYLVTDNAPNPASALQVYVELMGEWVDAVLGGRAVDHLIPVNVPPTAEWATNLQGRLKFLREEILSRHEEDLRACN